ncbi:MAG: hypothetical protein COV01_02945 [Candidatus Taylorbacteria bacterium CG10_big_fil_rev_8_21_14_0_10_41_48]|uniref:Uncharacterized protein n=1 Tax=Candidatus Taylorbacteria bacterium CG10_big_fil_rev_8_21_14_0_10_41_48 TaxID=1975024 RepID=A0A2M8LBR1_9BACT|nr:MAG: hypothetical protein COV01_02945 [Candidatus Taylorbacteria bacterium CG10_big_fil_rev_8_21_14_0_10_41_48]
MYGSACRNDLCDKPIRASRSSKIQPEAIASLREKEGKITMATDGPTPTPCDQKVFDKGTCLFVSNSIPSNAMEGWVTKVKEKSGQPVDWHFAGGRARVLALGDLERVKTVMKELKSEHDDLWREAVSKILGKDSAEQSTPPGFEF